jgi:acetyl esterase/lipase
MSRFVFYLRLIGALIWAGLVRIVRGPRRPGWSFRFELLVALLRQAIRFGARQAMSGKSDRDIATRVPRSLATKIKLDTTTFAGLPADIHTPIDWSAGGPTVLYLHGGAYIACSPRTHRELVARIAHACGARCVVPDYRLAPQHPFPAAVDDAVATYRAIVEEGTDPGTIFLAGDSAGGGLSVATMLSLRDQALPLPRGAVLLSPWVDLAGTGETMRSNLAYDYLSGDTVATARLYAKDVDLSHPLVSPVYADLAGLPPLLVQSGDAELLFSENVRLVERAREAGVQVTHEIEPGMVHVYQGFAAFSPQGMAAIASIGRFVGSFVHAREAGPESEPEGALGVGLPIAQS